MYAIVPTCHVAHRPRMVKRKSTHQHPSRSARSGAAQPASEQLRRATLNE
jgi:hypothetical protein